MENIIWERECGIDFVEKLEKDLLIVEFKDKVVVVFANNEELDKVVLK